MTASSALPTSATTASADLAIDITALTKSFSGRVVLNAVDFQVRHGSITSIIGRSGGGKTTLMRCINLLERPDSGSIRIDGTSVFEGKHVATRDLPRLRQNVGMVFQRFYLFPHLTAVENVMFAQMKARKVPEDVALTTALDLLDEVGLSHRAMAFPEQMSGGEQQRVAIARALALKPKVLLFDEPTSALDPESTRDVLAVMRRLGSTGMTMVIVTHEVPFAREVSDHVVFIDGGQIIEQGPPDQVIGAPGQARTQAFLQSYDS